MRLLGLVALLWAGVARAAPPSDEELAHLHELRGQAAYDAARWGDALDEFREALRLSRHPALHYNLAICHERAGHIADAVAEYRRYLAEVPGAADRAEVADHVEKIRPQITPTPQIQTTTQVTPIVPTTPTPQITPTAAPALTAAPARRPLYRRGWLWGVVGGVTAVAVVAVVLGVTLGAAANANVRTLPPVPLQ